MTIPKHPGGYPEITRDNKDTVDIPEFMNKYNSPRINLTQDDLAEIQIEAYKIGKCMGIELGILYSITGAAIIMLGWVIGKALGIF